MKRFRGVVLACLLAGPGAASAQTIRGVVLEDSTRQPISGVVVELMQRDSTLARTQTDSVGVFRVAAVRGGSFLLRLTHPSYVAVDSDPVEVGTGESVVLELRMGRTAIPLEPLVVRTQGVARLGGFYDRMLQPGFGRFLTRRDIDSRPGVRTTDLLRLVPGVNVVRVPRRTGRGASGGATMNVVTMRGNTLACPPAIFIDGTPVRQLPESGIDDILSPETIEGVEIYAGNAGVPIQFLEANRCGVIAFWTRRGDAEGGTRWSWKKAAIGAGIIVLTVLLVR